MTSVEIIGVTLIASPLLFIIYHSCVWRYVGQIGAYDYFEHRITGRRDARSTGAYGIPDFEWLDGGPWRGEND